MIREELSTVETMRKTSYIFVICLMLWASGIAVQAQTSHVYYCSAYLGTTPNTWYFSDSFSTPDYFDVNAVRDAFVKFVKGKYSPQSKEAQGGCSAQDKAVEEGNYKAGHKTVVETGWKPAVIPAIGGNH
jgi:hypothetical protein